MTREPYFDARAVEMAIKTSAEAAHRADPSISVSERIRQAHFDRLLCRVFSEGDASTWILKGGTGVLARVPNARATLDIDLYINGYSLDQALTALRRLVSIDLGDYFRFEYIGYKQSLAGDQQPYADGHRVTFEPYLGTKKLTNIGIDLVVGPGDLDDIEVTDPANRTALPRLLTYPYRLYPIVNQIADKVCATIATYPTGPSSRERDLVDLVIMASTQPVEAKALRSAINAEARRRGLGQPTRLIVPAAWGRVYEREARKIPVCVRHVSIESAQRLMTSFIDAALQSDHADGHWDPEALNWTF